MMTGKSFDSNTIAPAPYTPINAKPHPSRHYGWGFAQSTMQKTRVGTNSGPGTRGPTGIQLFLEVYTPHNLYYIGTFASSLAANPLFAHHDASYDVYQLEL